MKSCRATKNSGYMIHSVKFTCVLDTNVIYPIEIRDLLFWFAHYELYTHLKDFPEEVLEPYGMSAKRADDFLTDVIDLNHEKAVEAFRKMVMNRQNPDLDEYQVLATLRKNGLIETANYLHALL